MVTVMVNVTVTLTTLVAITKARGPPARPPHTQGYHNYREENLLTEQKQTCGVGSGLPQPCPHPAVGELRGLVPVCEGHEILYGLADRANELQVSLEYLERWIRSADRTEGTEPLAEALRAVRAGFAAELAELKEKEREVEERYSLPPEGPEQLEAKKRDEEPAPAELSLPESEGERRWRELDGRSSRLTAAATDLEAELDGLHARLEESVLPLLEEEADKANEEAARVKEEFGL